LTICKGHFEQLNNLFTALVLVPIQFVNDAEFAVEIRGRDNGDEDSRVLQLLLDLFLEINPGRNPVVEWIQIGRSPSGNVGSKLKCPVFVASEMSGFKLSQPPSRLWESPIKGDVKRHFSPFTGTAGLARHPAARRYCRVRRALGSPA
jgi:hypothetical protein